MMRIRFHGRGGHGVKTASRIVGTAAFLAGYQTQDSPIYGAERRGAPVAAFTRIDSQPILERGVIGQPDLIVIGDESLLGDPDAAVLQGHESAGAVFINSNDADLSSERHSIVSHVVCLDITRRTLDRLGKASALSVGLAAAAARMTGVVTEQQLLEALRDELGHTRMADTHMRENLALASEVFRELRPVKVLGVRQQQAPPGGKVDCVPHHDPVLATPSILAAGNSEQRQTGTWRVERPEVDYQRCTRCGVCFVRCPEGAITLTPDGYPVIDYEHCKGCMECWEQCPVEGAMGRKKEVRAWSKSC